MILLLALQAASTELLDALFAEAPAPPACSVTLDVEVTETAGGPTKHQVFAYDREAEVWTYMSVDGTPPSAEEVQGMREDVEGRPVPAAYYAEALGRAGLDWQPVTGEPGAYRADDLPEDEVEMGGRDVSARVAMTYLLGRGPDGPVLTSSSVRLKAPWRVPFVARIDDFAVVRDYAPAGAGTGVPSAMLPVREVVTFRGDVTGEARDSRIVTGYSGWDCVPAESAEAD